MRLLSKTKNKKGLTIVNTFSEIFICMFLSFFEQLFEKTEVNSYVPT